MFRPLSLLFTALSIFVFGLNAHSQSPPGKDIIKIRWVLAHEPVDLFKEAADFFSKEMKKKTNGKVLVEVMTVPEYERAYNGNKKMKSSEVVKYIQQGKIEMSQTYTTDLGVVNPDMFVLDLPFLFKDHGHAKKTLEGDVGEQLLAGLSQSNLRGLAFTYSGGYRIIPSNKPIAKVEDFKGLKIRTSNSPVAQDTFRMLGATPVPMGLDDISSAVATKRIEGAESTYPRFYSMKQNEFSSVLNDTQHSLFLTSIILNEKTWQSLSEQEKKAFKETAIAAARLERDQSIRDAVATREKCIEEGIKVYELSKSEQAKFKKVMAPLYEKYNNVFSKDLVAKIQKQ